MQVNNLGRNLKALRADLGINQNALAQKLNVTQATVSAWETGSKMPRTAAMIDEICAVFNCSRQDLLGYTDGFYAKRTGIQALATTSQTSAPVLGNIAAGEPREAFESVQETHWVRPDLLEKYPDGFFLRVSGDSMNTILPDGCFAFVAPGRVGNGDIAAVKVNGDEATVKRVKITDDVIILSPESTNPEHRRRVIDSTDPDAPLVRLLGRVVWADYEIA